jgi:hypothetical protein
LSAGKRLAVDVSIVSPTAKTYRAGAAAKSGSAAAKRELSKSKKYVAWCKKESAELCPFVLETFGHFGQKAIKLLQDLGSMAEVNTGETRQHFISRARAELSVALQISNAHTILNAVANQRASGRAKPSSAEADADAEEEEDEDGADVENGDQALSFSFSSLRGSPLTLTSFLSGPYVPARNLFDTFSRPRPRLRGMFCLFSHSVIFPFISC